MKYSRYLTVIITYLFLTFVILHFLGVNGSMKFQYNVVSIYSYIDILNDVLCIAIYVLKDYY